MYNIQGPLVGKFVIGKYGDMSDIGAKKPITLFQLFIGNRKRYCF